MKISYPTHNASKQAATQAANNSRCTVLRQHLVAITQLDRLAIVLNQLMFELASMPEGAWLRITAAEMIERTLLTVEPKTMRDYFRQLEAKGFIERRENPLDPRDRAFEYRINMKAINEAVEAAGFNVSPAAQKVPCNKKKKTLKPIRSLKSIKKNDNTIRARDDSRHEQDPYKTFRPVYHRWLRDEKTLIDSEWIEPFVQWETARVSQAIFTRNPETPGEQALAQAVVDGDLPLSYAVPLAKNVDLHDVTSKSVIYAAVTKFKQLPAWKLSKIVHPIRYLASMIHAEITDFFLDKLRVNPRYVT